MQPPAEAPAVTVLPMLLTTAAVCASPTLPHTHPFPLCLVARAHMYALQERLKRQREMNKQLAIARRQRQEAAAPADGGQDTAAGSRLFPDLPTPKARDTVAARIVWEGRFSFGGQLVWRMKRRRKGKCSSQQRVCGIKVLLWLDSRANPEHLSTCIPLARPLLRVRPRSWPRCSPRPSSPTSLTACASCGRTWWSGTGCRPRT